MPRKPKTSRNKIDVSIVLEPHVMPIALRQLVHVWGIPIMVETTQDFRGEKKFKLTAQTIPKAQGWLKKEMGKLERLNFLI